MDLDVERSRISYSLSRVHQGPQAIWAMTDRRDAAVGVAQRLLAEVEALQRAIGYAEKLARQEPVIEAAKAWAHAVFGADLKPIDGDEDHYSPAELNLAAAVDALETGDERVVSAALIGVDATKIPQLSPGTVVRIPGSDVDYIVDKGLETNGPKATLTFTTVDGLDWDEPRSPAPAQEETAL